MISLELAAKTESSALTDSHIKGFRITVEKPISTEKWMNCQKKLASLQD